MLSSLINGIVPGSLYALIALGPSLIYGILRVLDIANAAGLTLGAYMGLKVWTSHRLAAGWACIAGPWRPLPCSDSWAAALPVPADPRVAVRSFR